MMRLRHSLRLNRLLPVAATLLLGITIGAGALAVAGSNDTVYYACVNNGSGTIHVVDGSTTCANNELPISWNQQGPSGPQGPSGLQGPTGQNGADGAFSGVFTSPNGNYQISVTDDGIQLLDNVVGQHIEIAGGAITISGNNVHVQGTGSITIESSGTTTITGGLLTLNGFPY